MTNSLKASYNFHNRSLNFQNDEIESCAISFITNLIQQIRSQGNAIIESDSAKKIILFEASDKIADELVKNPVIFFFCLYNCVIFGQSLNEHDYTDYSNIFTNINYIKSLEEANEKDFLKFHNFYEVIHMKGVDGNIFHNIMSQINLLNEVLLQNVEKIIELLVRIFTLVKQNYLNPWKDKQRYVLNSTQQTNPIVLDIIQGWFENIAIVCWNTHERLKKYINICAIMQLDKQNNFITINENVEQLLTNLITNSFIIEKQPPQVLKVQTKFQSSVRLLIGNFSIFKAEDVKSKVEILFVNEEQAQYIHQTNDVNIKSCGIISNNTGFMFYNNANKILNAAFKNVQLTKRPEKASTESVMEEKYALCYKSSVSINNGELNISVWTLSMPVVVIVHGNQELQAWATILWENSISRYNDGLATQANVPWYHLSSALNMKFSSSMGSNGHYLTPENISFLQFKAFGRHLLNQNDLLITWQQFSKNPMYNQTFSFWDWFYNTMKLTRDYLRGLWNDGYIIGFIDKPTTEAYLLKCNQGTFLIRFSDSVLGNVLYD